MKTSMITMSVVVAAFALSGVTESFAKDKYRGPRKESKPKVEQPKPVASNEELEKKVADLEKQVADLKTRMDEQEKKFDEWYKKLSQQPAPIEQPHPQGQWICTAMCGGYRYGTLEGFQTKGTGIGVEEAFNQMDRTCDELLYVSAADAGPRSGLVYATVANSCVFDPTVASMEKDDDDVNASAVAELDPVKSVKLNAALGTPVPAKEDNKQIAL